MKEAHIPNPSLDVLGRKIAWSTLVQYAGKGVQLVLATLTLKLISNFLTQGDHGVYGLISEYALFFSTAANLGIFANVVRKMADAPRDGKVFLNALILRVITAALFFVSALLYLLVTGADSVFFIGSAVFLGALLFDYVTSVCDGMLQANYLMGRATFALILGRCVNFGIIFAITKGLIGAGAEAGAIPLLFGAVLAGSFVTAGLSLYFVGRKIEWSSATDWNFMWKILWISIPFGIINILNALYFRFLPDYFASIALSEELFAVFNTSFRIAQVLSLFSTFLMFSVLPGFKQYLDAQHWQKVRVLYKRVWQLLVLAGSLLVIGGSLFGPFFLELLTRKAYVVPELWFLLPMMLFLAAISYGYDLILITLFALEKDIWLLTREIIALSASLIFFIGSLYAPDMQTKVVLVMLGAIAGISIMVTLGSIKIKNLLQERS